MKREITKAYEPSQYEDEIYQKWERSGLFNPDKLKLPKNAGRYSIVMPPPNVTGTLHMGHAVMLALEDILIRYHRMKEEKAFWIPGTDHAAIATQTKVEKILKEEGLDRHKLGREKFLERVKKYAQESHNTIVNQIKKMGSSCDWSREAYTLDEIRTKVVRSVFKMMYDDGLIYRGERVVNWCPRCQSTLADDEVEYKTQKGKLYFFRYDKNFPITIATTRPETKLGDVAVAVNPKDKRYKKYVGKKYEVDFCGVPLKIRIIAERSVDMNFGSGAVGITPAHSLVDHQIAEKNKLPVVKAINEKGKIREGFKDFSGKSVREARELIIKILNNEGLMAKEEEVENNLSICYRCETIIEPIPSLQWFINVNKKISQYGKSIKELSIEAVKDGVFDDKKINIIPKRFEKSYFHWMENLHDWCISRQIWFGHRIPVWYKKLEVRSLPASARRWQAGKKLEANKEEKIYIGVEEPKGEGWVQDEDTLDTWFSSGLWTFSTMAKNEEEIKIKNGKLVINSKDFKNFHPTAVLETGYDILFFWVARMIIMTTYAVGDVPFRDVYLHGLIRDEQGKKMSKSLGNTIDPLDMIKKYGADATRLSLVIGTAPGNDMNLSIEKIAGFRNFTNKLWNIARYILINSKLPSARDWHCRAGKTQNSKVNIEFINLTLADKWILDKMEILIKEVMDDLDNYKFSQAGEKLREFTWSDLADWYLEASKFEKTSEKEKILITILKDLLKLWHPFMPFVTEVIWKEMGEKGLLMVEKWPAEKEYQKFIIPKAGKEFTLIQGIITAVRNVRSENKIEPLKKVKAVIYAGENIDLIKSQENLIKNLRTGINELDVYKKGEKIKKAVYTTFGDIEIYLIGVVDEEKEKERTKKETNNLERLVKGAEERFKNTAFLEKAPKKIVEKEKEKLENYKNELNKLKNIT